MSGCSFYKGHQDQAQYIASTNWQEQLKKINKFSFKGRIGFISKDNSGSGNISWQQNIDQFNIQLSGPFKLGKTDISGNHEQAHISHGSDTFAIQTEQLPNWFLQQGIPLPPIHSWIDILKANIYQGNLKTATAQLNEQNLPKSLEYQQLSIQYDQYSSYPFQSGIVWLPHKIKYQSNGNKLNLKIYEWQLKN